MLEVVETPVEPADGKVAAPPLRPPKAVLAMPFGKGVVVTKTFFSLWCAAARYGRDQLRFIKQERTLVDEARNRLVRHYRDEHPDAEYVIMGDDDLIYPFGNWTSFNAEGKVALPQRYGALNFFDRLLSHPPSVDIVGGAYFDRKLGGQLQCAWGVGSHEKRGFNTDFKNGKIRGLIEMPWVATGAMRIHRSVFDRIEAAMDRFPEIKPPANSTAPIGFFVKDRTGVGEDVAFCARAREVGCKVFLDADLRCLHKSEDVYY